VNMEKTECAASASNLPTPSTNCAAHRALERIGHVVGAFDPNSGEPAYVAYNTVRHIVRETWEGEWPDWQPAHDTTEHGDCSPWCPACRKGRRAPCSNTGHS